MSEQAQALGALLIRIADLCDAAEAQGIVENPEPSTLAALIDEAARLGIRFDAAPGLSDLHAAVERAAQHVSGGGP